MLADENWRAILRRDARFDGRFVFAVSSTKIFCRPSCPARRPLRANVTIFADAASAERAGFRPCRRCRPKAPASPSQALVRRAVAWLSARLDDDEAPNLRQLADAVGASPWHLHRAFHRALGVTPGQFARARRRETPRAREVKFTLLGSPLGRLLVAATDKGVCAVRLGDRDEVLAREIAADFPGARRDDAVLQKWAQAIVDSLDGAPCPSLPRDVRATAFQERVWRALEEIPRGETRSYGDIARALGRPKSARAVARACAANPLALIVPCHRVIPKSGATGGYRWGAARKKKLLQREK